MLSAVRRHLARAWTPAGPDPRVPGAPHRPLTTYAWWFRYTQPAVLGFAGACVERRHVRQAARCMVFWVAQPCQRATTGRYEGAPYLQRVCTVCGRRGEDAPVQDAMLCLGALRCGAAGLGRHGPARGGAAGGLVSRPFWWAGMVGLRRCNTTRLDSNHNGTDQDRLSRSGPTPSARSVAALTV